MARKVGFDKPDTEPKKSIADSYLDEFRQKSKAAKIRKATPKRPKVQRNWVVIIFLCIWLFFWTIGIVTVFGIIGSGGGEPFLYIWVTAALFGWFVAVGILISQIKGKSYPKKSSDE